LEGLPEHSAEVLEYPKAPLTPLTSDVNLDLFTKNEIITAIRRLNPKKAPGYDLITGKILRELPASGYTYVTHLFNSMLRTGFVPSQWKVSVIKMIPKPDKNPMELKSYRPISLLPIPAKLFETLLLPRISAATEKKNLIPSIWIQAEARDNRASPSSYQ